MRILTQLTFSLLSHEYMSNAGENFPNESSRQFLLKLNQDPSCVETKRLSSEREFHMRVSLFFSEVFSFCFIFVVGRRSLRLAA